MKMETNELFVFLLAIPAKKSNTEKSIDKLQLVNKYDFGMRDM